MGQTFAKSELPKETRVIEPGMMVTKDFKPVTDDVIEGRLVKTDADLGPACDLLQRSRRSVLREGVVNEERLKVSP